MSASAADETGRLQVVTRTQLSYFALLTSNTFLKRTLISLSRNALADFEYAGKTNLHHRSGIFPEALHGDVDV